MSKLLNECLCLLQEAFDELHSTVLEEIKDPARYIGRHHDYPRISILESGFPLFREYGFYDDDAPKDYTGMRWGSLFLMRPFQATTKRDFPLHEKLVAFLNSNELGKSFYEDHLGKLHIDNLIEGCVERYLHINGTGKLDSKRRDDIILQVLFGVVVDPLPVRLVVSIALIYFSADHFRLNKSSYIMRLSQPLQLSRSRIDSYGSSANSSVVGAATHAFVSMVHSE